MNYSDTFWKAFEYKVLVDYERAKIFVREKKMPTLRFSNMYTGQIDIPLIISSFC